MFSSSKQLKRYERDIRIRGRKEIFMYWVELFFIVAGFVLLLDLAYRLSAII